MSLPKPSQTVPKCSQKPPQTIPKFLMLCTFRRLPRNRIEMQALCGLARSRHIFVFFFGTLASTNAGNNRWRNCWRDCRRNHFEVGQKRAKISKNRFQSLQDSALRPLKSNLKPSKTPLLGNFQFKTFPKELHRSFGRPDEPIRVHPGDPQPFQIEAKTRKNWRRKMLY